MSYVSCQISNVKCQMSNVKRKMSNFTCQMSNIKGQMSNAKCQMSNIKCQMSNVKCNLHLSQSKGMFELRIRIRRSSDACRRDLADSFLCKCSKIYEKNFIRRLNLFVKSIYDTAFVRFVVDLSVFTHTKWMITVCATLRTFKSTGT